MQPDPKCFDYQYPLQIAPLSAEFKTLLAATKHEMIIMEQWNSENYLRRLPHAAIPVQATGHPAHQDDDSKGTRRSVEVRLWAVLRNRI